VKPYESCNITPNIAREKSFDDLYKQPFYVNRCFASGFVMKQRLKRPGRENKTGKYTPP